MQQAKENEETRNEKRRRRWGDTDRQVVMAWNGDAVKRGDARMACPKNRCTKFKFCSRATRMTLHFSGPLPMYCSSA